MTNLYKKKYSEPEALQALLQGKEEGLDYYFSAYYSSLTYFAFKLVADHNQAEEIAAEAFVKLWKYREHLSEEGSIKTWLYQIVRNASIDHLRKVKRLEVHKKGLQYIHQGAEETILHRMIEAEMLRQILKTIEQLPPKCGQVFQLYYLQGKSHEEISAQLGISPHTVRNQKERAMRLLKEKMGLSLFILIATLLLF